MSTSLDREVDAPPRAQAHEHLRDPTLTHKDRHILPTAQDREAIKGVSPTDTPRGSGGSNSIGGNSGGENNKGGNGNGMNNQPAPGSKYSYNSNGIGKKLNSGQINILTKRISANNNNISPNGSVKAVKAPKVSDLDSTKRTGEEELVIPENYSPVPSQRFEEVYKRGDILGSGAFGTVNKCTRISDPSQTFAVKIIERKKFKLRPMVQIALQREVAVMKMCSHVCGLKRLASRA
ncbi:hypothetical protein SARC_05120 [Sphaeroforma arctica JP610]|uniref:Protein kinase domain-containing protein n=1 Tax=Sphaeroforma arctica JP610 TaxID=667725 RepID=A0A0L0G1D5_9EUKA|nr:hypothetical protein SARC_05120 [Sphaeroforma arctica JP610]KNC82601.1 hypothetical protein SARC_05120 [Sphaeroforma arctica JP610]|eukprot:XP_014156503.1 hypothetical protein SARC_05120 [Sphaeroforma arctica JP610]